MQEVKDHFSRSQYAFELGKREEFTFGPELVICGMGGVSPTG
jgi:hypothetical protein